MLYNSPGYNNVKINNIDTIRKNIKICDYFISIIPNIYQSWNKDRAKKIKIKTTGQ